MPNFSFKQICLDVLIDQDNTFEKKKVLCAICYQTFGKKHNYTTFNKRNTLFYTRD